ncbi:MAG TPA: hypothetical protein PK079_07415 [Leptospiraceae bacterium]|nr:hypothetical protein [Leptospiraceae bacterium]HMW05794.1 hypothetical protein [Leptospiraceae bacterium]HMX32617.1 hypothetical protein [Leptospiraceae bacterium]HMY33331.1 hypothetical protein [Leptospiraceae bacterium]HMZ66205.1 hypothetical protein [Leptospiraceae bacterium]
MKEPVCTALLFADRVIVENNGKKGIIGTFNKIYAPMFPVQTAPWGIYAAITNVVGKHNFQVALNHMETNQNILLIPGEMQASNPDEVIELTFNTAGVGFPSEGKYSLSLTVGSELLSSIVLSVEVMKAIG